ncbi:MAG TPA: hypothetical protein VG518_00890 [Solirubrobacterales bacterium]|nr:hypothetical protein [Solirubrobacterales bacterium]
MTATINTRVCLRGVMAIAALVAAFAIPAHASASGNCSHANSDPTAAQYCPPVHTNECTEAGSGSGGSGSGSNSGTERCGTNEVEAASSESTSSGSLPFTGFDAVALLAAALALAAAGFALRRLSRPEH